MSGDQGVLKGKDIETLLRARPDANAPTTLTAEQAEQAANCRTGE